MDVNDMEGGAPSDGARGSPNPDVSNGQPAVPSPVTAPELETVLKVVKDLETQVRALQSGKDKGIAAVQREIKELKATREQFDHYRQLVEKGSDPDEAFKEVRRTAMLDELLARFDTRQEIVDIPGKSEVGNPQPKAGPATDVDPSVFGLDPNLPEVVELYKRGEATLDNFYQLAQRVKTRGVVQPDAGAILPTGGGKALPDKDYTEEYKQAMFAARGQGPHVGRQIKQKYREMGVRVDEIPLA